LKLKIIFLIPIGALCAIACFAIKQIVFSKGREEVYGKVLNDAGRA
jgi:hypothetical protein